jgi:hypothetical protein
MENSTASELSHCPIEDKIFQAQWSTYQLVLKGNHLDHVGLYDSASDLLYTEHKKKGRGLSLLELGCGDCDFMSRMLGSLSKRIMQESEISSPPSLVASYDGVDLSMAALNIAKSNLQSCLDPDIPVNLHHGEMLSWLQSLEAIKPGHHEDNQFEADIVVISFALHHLELQARSGVGVWGCHEIKLKAETLSALSL